MSRYDIAIIGMGNVFPKANSVEQYWKNIVSGETFFSKMPGHLWHLDNFYSPEKNVPEKTYTTVGSFIEDFEFPFLEYRLPPNALRGVDPTQLVTLEATKEALLDAGIEPRSSILEDAITVIGGSGVDAFAHSTTYLRRHGFFKKLRPKLEEMGVPKATIELLEEQYAKDLEERGHVWNPAIAAVGAIVSSVSNRVAQVFGIKGFNLTVDGACASSFTALDTACHALMAGDANVAIAGGADLGTNPAIYIGFSRVDGLSTTGMANPFDHNADGLVIGEGVGVVVLKRLEDAIANGDKIRAVIRGIGSSSDGAGQAIYAPSVEGRADALHNALKKSETDPDEVQFLEAHATSTIVGDANEYDAISTVYGPGRKPSNPLYLGSVKGQIGHLKAGAGMAGLIKTVLAMENATFPHMPNFTQLTPGATKPNEALQVNSKLLPWECHENGLRVGAITSSGFGGVNYHVILEQGETYQAPATRPKVPRDIAIVGVSCRVADAENVDQFWDNVTSAKDIFTEVDPKELGWEDLSSSNAPEGERITTRVVSRIGKSKLNLLRHKIFPTAVSQISPTQLLGVELGDRLLDEAGFALEEPKNIGVSVGSMHDDNFPEVYQPMCSDEYAGSIRHAEAAKSIDRAQLDKALEDVVAAIREECPPVTEHTLPGWMANVTAGRMANKLNLHGPNFTVDSACSSGLSALVPAMYQLMYGDVDMMISGGLNQQLSDVFTSGVCGIGAIAERVARPFDAEGKGFLIGEGGILYLLKRLDKAQKDGNNIFAVINSVSGSSEADSKSMIAPSDEAVRRSIKLALDKSSKPAEAIGVVDTHGSANLLSDLVEARSLAEELRPTETDNPVQLTAIKSHTGHLYGGSGAASMLSTIMSLRTRTVPGIRNLNTPRPEIENLKGRVQPRHGTEKLTATTTAGGVNSLGLGGANYFAVVSIPGQENNMNKANGGNSNMKPVPTVSTSKPSMRADDAISAGIFVCLAESLDELTAALGRAAQQSPIPQFISEGNATASRMAITYQTQEELENKINSALRMLGGGHDLRPLESQGIYYFEVTPGAPAEKLAFCFPGQGTHYISMGQKLYAENKLFRAVLDQVHELAMKTFDFDLLGHIHGDVDSKEIAKKLGTLVGAQTALFAVEVGMAKVLESMELLPSVMIGHSFGEISALTVAGVWDIETGYKVVEARIKAAEQIIKGGGPKLGMMSVICSDEQRDALLKVSAGKVVLTNVNAPGRFVFAGELDSVKQTVDLAESFGAEARLLPIGAAFHSHFMEPAREPFRKALAKLPCKNPRFPILSTITGEYIDMQGLTSEKLADHLSGQLITKLNLPREINRLYSEGVHHFLEVGPGWSMTKMINAILHDEVQEQRSAPTLHPKVGDEETFRRARAFLMALGHLGSAAERQNLPGMFSQDFLDYMQEHEPAVIGLLAEVHHRYLDQVTRDSMTAAGVATAPTAVATPAPTIAAQPAPTAAAAAPSSAVDIKVWIERVREKLVQTTGYPAEMLEEDLDLEADLGVDSVQRAEIWMALTGEHGLDSEARPTGIRTIAQLAASLGEMAGVGAPAPEAAPAAPAAAPSAGADIATWVQRVTEKLVQTTGYPAEMLEENLDLEADLGVDSVQRAEIWMALTGEYNLDSEARPTGVRTISQLAAAFAELEGPATSAPAQEETAPAAAPAQAPASPAAAADLGTWIERVREKLVQTTGYPAEMLEENLDLEADLGVDSVQRAEIWMALTSEYKLDSEARPTGVRTISQLAAAFAELAGPSATQEVTENPSKAAAPALVVNYKDDADSCRLFAASSDLIADNYLDDFECKNALLILGDDEDSDGGLGKRLTKKKIKHNSITSDELIAQKDDQLEKLVSKADTIYYLGHLEILDADCEDSNLDTLVMNESMRLFDVFKKLGPALAKHPARIVTPVSQDGTFGATAGNSENMLGSFPAGFMRSLNRELPDCRLQLLDTGDTPWDEALGNHADRAWPGLELGLTPTGRVIPTLGRMAPAIEHRPILNSGDLVLVTGGARGIVFECVASLAQRTGCKLLLTGRTTMPKGRPKWLSADPSDIDKVIRELEISLVREKGMALGDAKREGARSRSAWELNRNLERLGAMGIEASYEVCDVSSVSALKKLIKRVSKKETIHGIVHGAGVQQAKLIGDLPTKAIKGVLETKLNPMFAFLETVDWSEIKLLSGFGSVTGVFGNAGQTDYALGNDLMSWMIQSVKDEHPHVHTQTINWTAWTGTGMVSEEETKRFVQAGLVPLDIESGVTLFLEGVTGSSLSCLSAFNGGADFASSRGLSKFPVAPRPKAKLVEDEQHIRFSVDEDLYLDQHLVQDEPVVPGTFITELFNEASSSKGLVPSEIRFRRPLTVRDNELEVEAVQSGEAITLVPAERPDLNEQALANLAFATCRLSKPVKGEAAKLNYTKTVLKKLKAASFNGGAPFYNVLDTRFSHVLKSGPIFRGIRATIEENEKFYGLVTITDEAAALIEMPGEFIWNPVLADMAVQVAAAWSILRNDTMAIPASIGNVQVGAKSTARQSVVICQAHSLTPNETMVDVAVRDLDGKLILAMDKLVLRTIPG